MDFDKEYVKQQIEDLFGSVINFARTVGVSNSTIHSKLNSPSEKFIRQLKTHGIMINKSQINSNNTHDQRLIRILERLVKSLETSLESQRATNKMQEQSLIQKNEVINELTKKINKCRKKCPDFEE